MERIRVLLVEDEPVLAAIVKESLEKRGFHILLAANGVEGWTVFRSECPDICVIDVMMPRKDGFTLVSEIRLVDTDIPLLFLTARSQTEDVLKGFEVGADDYMRKPFSMDELIVRIKALVRRRSGSSVPRDKSDNIAIGNFVFRHQALELTGDQHTACLSQRESDLLLLLIQHKDQLLERKTALLKLWGEDNPFTARSMDVYITRLRKLFITDPTIRIINIRGQGYSLTQERKN